jgi:hypothetical protein
VRTTSRARGCWTDSFGASAARAHRSFTSFNQLAEGASREVCGKEAVSLERGLALKEVDVFLKTLAGATRHIRFVSRGGDAYAILCEATIGDVLWTSCIVLR